jgi:hypothetical protein
MSSEERRKILQMVEEGKISAEEAQSLMRALDEDADEASREAAEAEIEVIESRAGSGYENDASSGSRRVDAPEFEEIKARARRFAFIPLWIGVFITVFSAWIIYSIQQSSGVNFWFYCMMLPLLVGVLLIALGAGGPSSRWLYVDVDRRNAAPGDGPRHITLGFPVPFGLVTWFFETFGHNISGMNQGQVDGIVQMMHATRDSKEPLMINVDDDDARVQLYIG